MGNPKDFKRINESEGSIYGLTVDERGLQTSPEELDAGLEDISFINTEVNKGKPHVPLPSSTPLFQLPISIQSNQPKNDIRVEFESVAFPEDHRRSLHLNASIDCPSVSSLLKASSSSFIDKKGANKMKKNKFRKRGRRRRRSSTEKTSQGEEEAAVQGEDASSSSFSSSSSQEIEYEPSFTRSPPRRDMLPSPTPSQLADMAIDPNSIPITSEDTQPKSFIGLSDKEAYSQLIKSVEELLDQNHRDESLIEFMLVYLGRIESLVLIGVVLLMAFVFCWGWFRGTLGPEVVYQFRFNGVLAEIVVLFLVLAWNGVMYYRENRLTSHEVIDRTRSVLRVMEDNRARPMRPLKLPFCPIVSIVNVYRDGMLQQMPVNLTVDGDVVEIPFGTTAFCDMEYLGASPQRLKLARGMTLKPDFFSFDEGVAECQSTFKFLLCETRFAGTLAETLQQKRPRSVIDSQRAKIRRLFSLGFGFGSLVVCGLVNLVGFILRDVPMGNWDHFAEVLLREPGYALLAWLPLWMPSLWFVVRSYCNAHTLVLFEALQKSKEEFEDDDDIDEFDTEAPSPTKDVEITVGMVLEKWWWLMSQWNQVSLTRSTNLFESLGSITMICALDKEETIATPFPELEQLLFIDERQDTVLLDLNEDKSTGINGVRFEDQDWQRHLGVLKPLGLTTLLCTRCGVLDSNPVTYKPAESHLNNLDLDITEGLAPARQTCFCRLGKEVGFSASSLVDFRRKQDVVVMAPFHPALNHRQFRALDFEIPLLTSSIYLANGSYQLMSMGHTELVLDVCADYWDGQGLCALNDTIETKIYDFYQNAVLNDMQCVAYAYRPIAVKDDQPLNFLEDFTSSSVKLRIPRIDDATPPASLEAELEIAEESKPRRRRVFQRATPDEVEPEVDAFVAEDDPESFFWDHIQSQVFLAMSTSAHQPKHDVCDVIEDLKLAGIRFVYFSPKGERRSKAFAERLGMETDWNTCIRLSASSEADLDDHYLKARLPRGIETMRHHLENVDDIPLQVSLFAECSPEAILEMIQIFQEYGEVVCCLGNSLNHLNTPAFATADLGISVEPLLHRRFATTQLFHSTVSLGSVLTSLPCALSFNRETSLFVLTQIIREARRLLNAVRQGGSFLLAVGMAISLLVLLNSALTLPPVLAGHHILWLQWIIGPIITLPFLFTPHEPNTMTTMVGKNKRHLLGFPRLFGYGLARMLGSILIWETLFITAFHNLRILTGDNDGPFSRRGDWFTWTPPQQWALLLSQNLVLFFMVFHLALISGTFLSRTLFIWEFGPHQNTHWLLGIAFALILQSIYTLVFSFFSPFPLKEYLSALPSWFFLLGFASPLLLLPFQELVRWHDRIFFSQFQKRSKLEFNTKLGLHSPV
ncbi:hypothetical protein DSO57_1031404 [Entomophthora muscae]|uniref:Uncharacterized protein n=1 Tax=Entomophthora muscae TaxID=34485 RepID=A0ACC2RFE8_9FUNG|nr:hypothetical protein DSO57_1031404 [Entomophthora muscae]